MILAVILLLQFLGFCSGYIQINEKVETINILSESIVPNKDAFEQNSKPKLNINHDPRNSKKEDTQYQCLNESDYHCPGPSGLYTYSMKCISGKILRKHCPAGMYCINSENYFYCSPKHPTNEHSKMYRFNPSYKKKCNRNRKDKTTQKISKKLRLVCKNPKTKTLLDIPTKASFSRDPKTSIAPTEFSQTHRKLNNPETTITLLPSQIIVNKAPWIVNQSVKNFEDVGF
ncbi:hypothetical protein BB558_003496 [Smittium angustum]|uniref:Carbohydrate-binding module family 19 domain-containing protein n=1 Tax=Smittium angustum TaxID=133377 RepID=A0A2U1J678_SMIAN|nr:hypothetical protein BB558_003496 [Smittium angustum]